jgi:SAM-dependent methyltransferase
LNLISNTFRKIRSRLYTIKARQIFKTRAPHMDALDWVWDRDFSSWIIKFIKPDKEDLLLDVATGTGALLIMLAPYVKEGYGIDISEEMIKLARKNIHQRSIENISALQESAENLHWENDTFSLITCRNGLHHLADLECGISEMKRVLKPGGRLIVIEGIAFNETDIKTWRKILKIKDVGRNPDFFLSEDNVNQFFEKLGLPINRHDIFVGRRSVKNWLEHSGLSPDKQKYVWNLLRETPQWFKKKYELQFNDNDATMLRPSVIIEWVKTKPPFLSLKRSNKWS